MRKQKIINDEYAMSILIEDWKDIGSEKEKELDFNEIDERLLAGWYVCSGQRKRYLKSISKKK